MLAALTSLAGLAVCVAGCFGGAASVTRFVGGQALPERYISPGAYANYAEGAVLQARGDLRGALSAYLDALAEDPVSAELWTRVASLRCRLHSGNAQAALSRAERLDASYAPLWRERARCDLARGQTEAAIREAQKSLKLDPDDEETNLFYIRLCELSHNLAEERRWLDALVTERPRSVAAWKALLAYAKRHADRARLRRAAEALSIRAPGLLPSLQRVVPALGISARLDRALSAGQDKTARRLALSLHLGPGQLALRAAALGRTDLARGEAELVLQADPSNSNAWVARLVAADLAGNDHAFERVLETPRAARPRLSLLGANLWAGLLRRRIGEDAAKAWLAAYRSRSPRVVRPPSAASSSRGDREMGSSDKN